MLCRMGHWDQIGRDNAAERERQAALPAWRRALAGHAREALAAASWVALGVVVWLLVRR